MTQPKLKELPDTQPQGDGVSPKKMLLTVEDVAYQLSLGRTYVYGLVMTGQLLSIKIGGRRRIPFFALEVFVTDQIEHAQR